MTAIYILFGLLLLAGIGIAIYEWRSKHTLLQHDLTKSQGENAYTESERIRAEGVVYHNPSSGMY